MFKIKTVLGITLLFLFISAQQPGIAPCPLQYQLGSVVSARITVSGQRGIIPLIPGQDVNCYNYSLPYAFAKVPEVAIGIHDFDAKKSDDLFFSIKPTKTESLSYLPLLVRTHWKYTEWRKISFSILVEDRSELQSGYYQVDTGILGGCEPGKTILALLPFRHLTFTDNINHLIFLNGFQISSQFYSASEKSPFEVQVLASQTNSSGISVYVTLTTITQVHALHLSYIAWESTDLNEVFGKYSADLMNVIEIAHTPDRMVGRNYARIFGINGFLVNNNDQDFKFSTHWSGSKFIFDWDASTPFIHYLSFEYLFFLGSECSDCLNYPLIFNGTCRQFCPDGYHATGENVCIDCGEGYYWNGTSCIKECPQGQFLNTQTNECNCPAGLHWNGKVCVSCAGGKIFNADKNICECPNNTRWNGYGCSTIQVCKDGKTYNVFKFMCQCPMNSRWNGTFCVKKVVCRNGQIFDGQKGCVCPPNTHWNGQWCQTHSCGGGQEWNGTACSCKPGQNYNGSICLLCINGQEWNPTSKKCECPGGFVWNGNFCKKFLVCSGNRVFNETVGQCLCPTNQFWNGFQCMVQPDCCCGKIWNEKTFQCNCPDNFNWDGTSCVLCLNGKVWDSKKNQCMCREGTKWNGHFCVVIQECFGGTIWNQNTWSCECPSVTVWNGKYCQANPCVGGQFWNGMRRRCQCPQGLQFIGGICKSPAQHCTPPKQYSTFFADCVCPPGTFDSGLECLPLPTCDVGLILDQSTGQCRCEFGLVYLEREKTCADPTCPANERWNGFGCVEISCPPNSYYNGTECVCPDPRDYCKPWQYYDGRECVYQPGSCPDGTKWNGTYCAPENNCPVGFYGAGSSCMPLPQKCIPPTHYSNGRCLVSGACPHGTYFRSGNCIPYVPCQNGQMWNNDKVNCVCPEGTEWNGQKCLACSGGKTWQPFMGCVCPTGFFFSGSRCERVLESRCSLIPNAFWDSTQCVCHEGFNVVGMQCVCDGVVMGNRCDRCAHRPNSEWRYGSCRCKTGYTLYGTQCLGNQIGDNTPDDCNVGTFYDSQQRRCLPCPAGCLSCSSSYSCTQCRPQFNFDSASELCIEHCGDGKRFVLECDDGNDQDGDGCSFDCKVEAGFLCRGGSPNQQDSCIVYQPSSLTMRQTGQIRYSSKMVININLDYLPRRLIQSSDCNDRCSNVLDGKLTSGDMQAVSIKSSYLAGTTYSFSIEIEFGRSYIGKFTLQVMVNPMISTKYFQNINTSQPLIIEVNPALLSKVVNEDYL